jgi:hypothetical protein
MRVWSKAEKYLANGERQFGQSQQSCMGVPATLPRPVMSGLIGMARVGARMSPKRRLAVRQIDSAPLLSGQRNWFVVHASAVDGVREGVLADFGFAIAKNECSRPS